MNVETKVRVFDAKEGDSILVEVAEILTNKQIAAVQRTVEKWSGGKYPVLVICLPLMRVTAIKGS